MDRERRRGPTRSVYIGAIRLVKEGCHDENGNTRIELKLVDGSVVLFFRLFNLRPTNQPTSEADVSLKSQRRPDLRYFIKAESFSMHVPNTDTLKVRYRQSLPGFHAITGCDFNPAFFRKGKSKPYKTLKKISRVPGSFQELCNLPPCKSELLQQFLRANYICTIWSNAHLKNPTTYQPDNNGWILKDQKYQFKWFEGDQLPSYVSDSLKTQSETDGEGDIDDDEAIDWSNSDEENENIDDNDEN
ncbi:hypothetical protein EVAR_50912_1 [Eumeta japonica]|uniref:Uncharacterized protein n=1 Tax=Eumeta variegata TaxID=151549 RepID=A0A4C1YC31_EUMVA|nr:hypothetical protein EVAR_50912_1 [Eumeta japonica]